MSRRQRLLRVAAHLHNAGFELVPLLPPTLGAWTLLVLLRTGARLAAAHVDANREQAMREQARTNLWN